jgi:hypothetical protein
VKRSLALAAIVLALAPAGFSAADAVRTNLAEGNRLLAENKPEDALKAIEAARAALGSRPEPPELALSAGCAKLALGKLDEADAALAALDGPGVPDAVRGRAAYNRGQIDFKRSQSAAEKDPKAALEALRRAERHFRTALQSLPSDADAARNIEVTQRTREALEEQLRRQQEQQKQQQQQQQNPQQQPPQPDQPPQDQPQQPSQSQQGQPQDGQKNQNPNQQQQQQEKQDGSSTLPQDKPQPEQGKGTLSDQINNLTKQQQSETTASRELADKAGRDKTAEDRNTTQQQHAEGAKRQEDVRKESEEAEARAREEAAKESASERKQDLERAADALDRAQTEQRRAEEALRNSKPEDAAKHQREAAEQLAQARRLASGEKQDEQPPPEGDQAQPAEQAGEPRAFSRDAAEILDKERRERELFQRWVRSLRRDRPPPVEKDW